jgi:hypothetical protein
VNHPRFLLLFALGLASVLNLAGADPAAAKFGRLHDLLAKQAENAKAGPNGARSGETPSYYLVSTVTRAQLDFERGNFENVDQLLRPVFQFPLSPEAANLIQDILTFNQSAWEQRDRDAMAKINALVARTATLCLAAKDERELDDLLIELNQARLLLYRSGGNNAMQGAGEKLEGAQNFVRRWQDYLAQQRVGNAEAARRIIADLANNSSSYLILPRSELLARAVLLPPKPTPKPAAPVMHSFTLKSLDDLPAAIQSLRQSGVQPGGYDQASILLTYFISLQEAVESLAVGNIGAAMQAASAPVPPAATVVDTQDNTPSLGRLRQALLLRILPRYFSGHLPEPHEGENASDYLLRLFADAKQAQDWPLALRILGVYAQVCFTNANPPLWVADDISAIRTYLLGMNLERAEDYAGAMHSYQSILQMVGTDVPMDDVVNRMKELRPKIQAQVVRSIDAKPQSRPIPR